MTDKSILRELGLRKPPLKFYVEKIRNNEPYTFVRYGDGEWSCCILGDRTRTGSGSHDLTDRNLKAQLKRSLTSMHLRSNYMVSLRPNSVLDKPFVGTWLLKNCKKRKWHDCRVFSHASMRGQLRPFVDVLRNLEVPLVFVGPEWLKRLRNKHRIFPRAEFIIVPTKDCYKKKQRILQQMRAVSRPAFFSISAGPAAKVICYELYWEFKADSFMLDLGSLWDVYADHPSRQYHRRIRPAVKEANLGK